MSRKWSQKYSAPHDIYFLSNSTRVPQRALSQFLLVVSSKDSVTVKQNLIDMRS
jgi:hypothetical protein